MVQQYRQVTWLILEVIVCCAAGTMMGLASTTVDELYSGILRPPYTPLSPAPLEALLPSLGLYVSMSLGIAGAPAAVRIFGEERDVFLREAASGHSTFSYFVAKNVATLPRMMLAGLHFAGFFSMLARPSSSFLWLFTLSMGILWGVYGVSFLVSMTVSRANAALLGVISTLSAAFMCGFGPTLVQGREWGVVAIVQELSYARWATEFWLHAETLPYRNLFFVTEVFQGAFGYTLDRPDVDVVMMIVIGLGLRTAAYAGLLLLARWRGGGRGGS